MGLHPEAASFGYFFAVVIAPHIVGELLTLVFLGVIQNPNVANGGIVLLTIAGVLAGSGLVRYSTALPTNRVFDNMLTRYITESTSCVPWECIYF